MACGQGTASATSNRALVSRLFDRMRNGACQALILRLTRRAASEDGYTLGYNTIFYLLRTDAPGAICRVWHAARSAVTTSAPVGEGLSLEAIWSALYVMLREQEGRGGPAGD